MPLRIPTSLALLAAVPIALLDARSDADERSPSDAAPGYAMVADIGYYGDAGRTEHMERQCRLDVYHPTGVEGFPTIVWFHAGGLTSGERWIPEGFKERGIAVVPVSYRLSPEVTCPAYIEDAAAAVAWTLENIESFGGSRAKVFVSGHSAGGYLASMVGLDKRWLGAHGIDADELAGLIPISGHTITHFTVRAERGIDGTTVVVDDMAPLHHVRADAPPILLITGDREQELFGRYEENAFMWRMMRVAGHAETEIEEIQGFDHGGVVGPAQALTVGFVERTCARR